MKRLRPTGDRARHHAVTFRDGPGMGVPQLKYLEKKIKYLENLGAAYIAHLKGFWLPHSFHIKDADQLTQSYSQLLKYQVQCDILERKNETKHFS